MNFVNFNEFVYVYCKAPELFKGASYKNICECHRFESV